ncbi:hypothetical protein AQ794_18075 [Burkholderia pseudomallei]|nr:hypothetical protein AQ753_06385 [Burkholderia pseudomallei]OMT27691.1 hypothetical protein AQ754_27625 [Burkholderia pseudomallei]OMV41320.1 hypothetical protein AQ791_02015 [Burkholderia pseudomallei]OMV42406.1 hypothetical protein AQ792_03710 [Burkholderia pseudomallei]OMV45234.1 hypothetical protein AQ793_23865 [Burkholderia pseudomallei]
MPPCRRAAAPPRRRAAAPRVAARERWAGCRRSQAMRVAAFARAATALRRCARALAADHTEMRRVAGAKERRVTKAASMAGRCAGRRLTDNRR